MTAPDRTTWTVAEDPNGDLTLFCDRVAVRRRFEVTEVEWDVLTRVLAPDEATVERLAEALWERIAHGATSQEEAEEHWRFTRLWYIDHAKAVLAALAGTSAQARHAADETGGGAS